MRNRKNDFWLFDLEDRSDNINFEHFGLSASAPSYPSVEVRYHKDDPPLLAFFICRERLSYLDPTRFENSPVRDLLESQRRQQLASRANFLREYCKKSGSEPGLYPAPGAQNSAFKLLVLGPPYKMGRSSRIRKVLSALYNRFLGTPVGPHVFFTYSDKNMISEALNRLIDKLKNAWLLPGEACFESIDAYGSNAKFSMVLPLVAPSSSGIRNRMASMVKLRLEIVALEDEKVKIICYWFETISPLLLLTGASRSLKKVETAFERFYEDLYGKTSYFKVQEKDAAGTSEREGLLLNYGVRLEENLLN